MKRWVIYFREYNDDDAEVNVNPTQTTIYDADTTVDAIRLLQDEIGSVHIIDIFLMRGLD
jgi:hypothetical protein